MRSIQFTIKHNIGTKRIFELVSKVYSPNATYQANITRQYFDTFDWRLYQKSYLCGMDHKEEGSSFFVRPKNSDNTICEFPLKITPKFSRDISHRTCRELLDNIIGIRALITVATISIKRREVHILNHEHKTLIKLQIESYSIVQQAGAKSIPGRLIIFPIKGYKKIFQNVSRYVNERLALPQATSSILEEALVKIGKAPDTKSLKITYKLNDSLNTWEAVQILLNDLLNIMLTNEQGIREAIDTEFLHDYRVAVRRTRSILTQIKHLFSNKELEYFKQEFYWLGLITSPTRDLDVYLLKFDNYIKELPQELQVDLIPFGQFLHRHWKIEHKHLCEAFDSQRYHKLIKAWQQRLRRKNIHSPQAFNAEKPARQVANQRIWKLYQKVNKEGAAITDTSNDEDLHELRKTCKKLRYLMEFFQGYYTKKQISGLIKTLKQLQDNLGDFQDLCIQTQQLNQFAQQMQEEGVAGSKTFIAMGILVQKLIDQKAGIRANFDACFKILTYPDKKREFEAAFNPKNQSRGISS